jgi:hypothetical protein
MTAGTYTKSLNLEQNALQIVLLARRLDRMSAQPCPAMLASGIVEIQPGPGLRRKAHSQSSSVVRDSKPLRQINHGDLR